MEKFLEKYKLFKGHTHKGDCFLIEVKDQSGNKIDELHCYCTLDMLRIKSYYLDSNDRFWYSIKVTKC